MSIFKTPCFIHHGSWDDELRSHPALKWMEWYTKEIIDARKFDEYSATDAGHTPDFVFQKSTGEVISGADKAWAGVKEVYAPFSAQVHDPQFLVSWETENGWEMFGIADLWYNLAAPPSEGEKRVKGIHGEEWDGVLPSAFKFNYVKGGKHGVQLARTEVYSDPSAALVRMLKRGMVKPEDLVQG
jgi:hypothetical protein